MVFVDCSVEVAPGKVSLSRVRTVGARPAVEHGQCTPEAVMDIVEVVYRVRPEAWAMGIGPASLEMGDGIVGRSGAGSGGSCGDYCESGVAPGGMTRSRGCVQRRTAHSAAVQRTNPAASGPMGLLPPDVRNG